MAGKIHLIEHLGNMNRLDKTKQEWESGGGAVSKDTAERLVGGEIYFHKEQKSRSFFGGKIIGYRVEEAGDLAGRVIFKFSPEASFKGVLAGADGWGMEKKIVL